LGLKHQKNKASHENKISFVLETEAFQPTHLLEKKLEKKRSVP
jgi:hypothetical protein